tara:strand:- start:602 stop:913 length:312 start_codon:yes stop_codon:yes gene_type:complete
MKNEEITEVQHIWVEDQDRWVYLEYNKLHKIIGMNFMQGYEYVNFKDQWCYNDIGLTDYYNMMLYTFPIEKASVDTLAFVNKCMWSYHHAKVEICKIMSGKTK